MYAIALLVSLQISLSQAAAGFSLSQQGRGRGEAAHFCFHRSCGGGRAGGGGKSFKVYQRFHANGCLAGR
jgi:hypothetical protein